MLFCARLYGANNVSNGNNVIISAICKCTEGGCTHVMHGRSRITIDPRIPTLPGRSVAEIEFRTQKLVVAFVA